MGRELTMKLCAGWYLGLFVLTSAGSLRLQRQAAADRRFLKGATFEPPPDQQAAEADPFLRSWRRGQGLYCSNGSLIGIMKRSSRDVLEPDLYIFGIPGEFRGYKPGYSKLFERFRNRFTWVILKASTNNAAGRVLLRSDDPRETPRIEFRYFDEGSDGLAQGSLSPNCARAPAGFRHPGQHSNRLLNGRLVTSA